MENKNTRWVTTSGMPLPDSIENAFAFMEINQPAYPKELIGKLGAYNGNGSWAEQNLPYFKGWVGTVDGKTRYSADLGLYPEDLSAIAYLGLWVGRTALQIIYCAIPSMENGLANPGQTIEMGEKRIKIGEYSQEELDGFVIQGWDVIQKMIKQCGEYTPKVKASIVPQA